MKKRIGPKNRLALIYVTRENAASYGNDTVRIAHHIIETGPQFTPAIKKQCRRNGRHCFGYFITKACYWARPFMAV